MINRDNPHIFVHEANAKGNDIVIGDIHNSNASLRDVIATLNENDRLYIVGDLTDRGEDAVGVIKQLIANSDRVFAIRGNHENDALSAIENLKLYAKNFEGLTLQEANKEIAENPLYKDIQFHVTIGGQWLVDLFVKELATNKIDTRTIPTSFSSDSDIKKIENYMLGLPYIMHVKGNESTLPFNVVHADMPFDDHKLFSKIASKNLDERLLSSDEIRYALHARNYGNSDVQMKEKGRDITSCRTYCGHNVVEFQQAEMNEQSESYNMVRPSTNTINLDVGAYYRNALFTFNHKTGAYKFVGPNAEEVTKEFNPYSATIDKYLLGMKPLEKFCQLASQCKNPVELTQIILKFASEEIPHHRSEMVIHPTTNHIRYMIKAHSGFKFDELLALAHNNHTINDDLYESVLKMQKQMQARPEQINPHIHSLPTNIFSEDIVLCTPPSLVTLKEISNAYTKGERIMLIGAHTENQLDTQEFYAMITNNKDKFYPVRNNVDDMMLAAIACIENNPQLFIQFPDTNILFGKIAVKEEFANVMTYQREYGIEWLHKLLIQEIKENKISVSESGKLIFSDESQLKQIKDCVSSLPYIIHVEGDASVAAFNVVNGSVPFSDEQLQQKIKSREPLQASEIDVAINPADSTMQFKGTNGLRSEVSSLTYSNNETVRQGSAPLSQDSTIQSLVQPHASHVYLNGKGASLILRHTKSEINVSGPDEEYIASNTVTYRHVAEYLTEKRAIQPFLRAAANCKTASELDKVLNNFADQKLPHTRTHQTDGDGYTAGENHSVKKYSYNELKQYAVNNGVVSKELSDALKVHLSHQSLSHSYGSTFRHMPARTSVVAAADVSHLKPKL